MRPCLGWNGFYTNFSILSITPEKIFGLSWFLHEFEYLKEDV